MSGKILNVQDRDEPKLEEIIFLRKEIDPRMGSLFTG